MHIVKNLFGILKKNLGESYLRTLKNLGNIYNELRKNLGKSEDVSKATDLRVVCNTVSAYGKDRYYYYI